MKSIIICSGNMNDYEYFKKLITSDACIICADGGARHTYNMGIIPDIIIGDYDSIGTEYMSYFKDKNIKMLAFPKDKDNTDTDLCLDYAMGISDEIVLLGATGTRLDHSIANVMLLVKGLDKGKKISLMDENNEVYLINKSIKLVGNPGELVSIIPIDQSIKGVTTRGLHFRLSNATINRGSTWGISNVFESCEAEISINEGHALIIKSRD